ncbi:hypothetical protein BH24ACT15_BH24ACT15_21700 [soil metagenome]
MDNDELDQWLDADEADTTQRRPWQQDPPSGPRGPGTSQRPPWKWLAVAGAAIWAVVMGVVFLGSDGAAEPADTVTPTAPGDLMAAVDTASLPSPTPPPVHTSGEDPEGPARDDTTGGAQVATADSLALPPGIEAGAVSALRARLTVPGVTASYLEWATPVDAEQLQGGIWVVVLEAIWLEGTDGDLTTSHQGRWAVPIADDGRALSTPWPHQTPPAPIATATPVPPEGTVRISEAAQALVAAGWTDVDVTGSAVHPVADGVIVVMVEGIPPLATQPTTQMVWLRDTTEGALGVLGSDR